MPYWFLYYTLWPWNYSGLRECLLFPPLVSSLLDVSEAEFSFGLLLVEDELSVLALVEELLSCFGRMLRTI